MSGTTFSLKNSAAALAGAALMSILVATPASADRLSDKDVKALIEKVDDNRDRFEDQLDGKLKRSIIRGPGGEVNVERYLDDLQENVDKLKERFKPEYAASAEVTTILRQGSDIDRYMATLPAGFDGASEWNRLRSSLGELAAAYSTSMPMKDGQQARRLNDKEVQKAATEISKGADQYKKALDSSLKKDKSIDAATRQSLVAEADGLKEDAKRLASTIGGGRPASGEAEAVVARAAKIKDASTGRQLSPAESSAWALVATGLDKVAQGFGK